MNVSDQFDWTFMWQMFRNFVGTLSPFVMMAVAVGLASFLLGFLVYLFLRRRD